MMICQPWITTGCAADNRLVWVAFDEWTAILAGDALLTLAFEILAAPETHPDPATRLALISGLARAAGAAGMVGGQALDLGAERLSAERAADGGRDPAHAEPQDRGADPLRSGSGRDPGRRKR